jgi:hypothetical protein
MLFWNAFTLAGISPFRQQSIVLHFPNLTEQCGTDRPWSCSTDGDVYVIPDHANANAIQHELAHELNREFWSSFPAGSGQDHNLTDCSNPGTALTEGFAEAVPFWVAGNFTANFPYVQGASLNIEEPLPWTCEGDWNESRVAATLWDLIDTRDDGLDTTNLSPSVIPFTVYLWAGPKTSFRYYLPDHIAFTPPRPIPLTVDAYRQNTIATP